MKIQYCPKCHGTDLRDFAGGVTGTIECKKCGYVGSLVIEKTFVKQAEDEL